jgi:hypothetical protein
MRKDVDQLPLETSVAIDAAVALADIPRGDRRSIATTVFFFLRALLLRILQQATRPFTVPHHTWRTGNQPVTRRMAVHG